MGWKLLERKTAKGGPGSFIKMPGSLIDSRHGMLMPAERAQGCIQSEHAESAENMRGLTGSPIGYKTDWD